MAAIPIHVMAVAAGLGRDEEPLGAHRHQGADGQLPGAGEGGEIGHGGMGGGLHHRKSERGGDDHEEADSQPRPQRPSRAECGDEQEHGGVHQVELLLDGQRPEVEQG